MCGHLSVACLTTTKTGRGDASRFNFEFKIGQDGQGSPGAVAMDSPEQRCVRAHTLQPNELISTSRLFAPPVIQCAQLSSWQLQSMLMLYGGVVCQVEPSYTIQPRASCGQLALVAPELA